MHLLNFVVTTAFEDSVFWDVLPCQLGNRCQNFTEVQCLHLQGQAVQENFLDCLKEALCFSKMSANMYQFT